MNPVSFHILDAFSTIGYRFITDIKQKHQNGKVDSIQILTAITQRYITSG